MPSDEGAKTSINEAIRMLDPFCTAMSLEDEITVLEMIEQHEDFSDHIADDARIKARELHEANESLATMTALCKKELGEKSNSSFD
jgi:hypothetical protein